LFTLDWMYLTASRNGLPGASRSPRATHICVVDGEGAVVRRDVVATDPDVLAETTKRGHNTYFKTGTQYLFFKTGTQYLFEG
jgi:hypothetical protein